MATFSFFELHTPDLERARRFYGALFGWNFEEMPNPGPRFLLSRSEGHQGGIVEDSRPHWLNYITVGDCRAAAAKAQELGGRVLSERVEIPGRGAFIVVADPAGAPMALWQEAAK